MKQNKLDIILLFLLHIYLYCIFYILFYNIFIFVKTDFFIFKDFILQLLLSPIGLLFIDYYYLLYLFSPVIFYLILQSKVNSPVFRIYMVSVVSVFCVNCLVLLFTSQFYTKIIVMSYDGDLFCNKLFFMIPSLLVTIIINKLIFNKIFKSI